MKRGRAVLVILAGMAALAGCGRTPVAPAPPAQTVIKIEPGPDVQEQTQTALIKAKPGDVVEFGAGTFDFTMGLSLTVPGVTVRGQGMEKTILSFKKQNAGSEGLLVTGDAFKLEDLTIEDAKGDGVKVNGTDGVTFSRVRVRWTGGEKETNGAYGLYPVQCKNVLIDECVAEGASDAGIYVGQSEKIIVRHCRAERNVAGIEIENSTDADVIDNVVTNNTGGLLVFDLPGLPVKNGRRVRLFDNKVLANNHPNFAPKGGLVASVPPGMGVMVMATDQVEVVGNVIKDNQTCNLSVVSYHVTGRPIDTKDSGYDPISEGVYIHDNTFAGGGGKPAGEFGQLFQMLLGTPVPDIIYDGIVNPKKLKNGQLPPALRLYIRNNGTATFANLMWGELGELDPKKPLQSLGKIALHRSKVSRELKPFDGELPPLPPVTLGTQ